MFSRGDFVQVVPDAEWPEHDEMVGQVGRVVASVPGGYMVGLLDLGAVRAFTEPELERVTVH